MKNGQGAKRRRKRGAIDFLVFSPALALSPSPPLVSKGETQNRKGQPTSNREVENSPKWCFQSEKSPLGARGEADDTDKREKSNKKRSPSFLKVPIASCILHSIIVKTQGQTASINATSEPALSGTIARGAARETREAHKNLRSFVWSPSVKPFRKLSGNARWWPR